MIDSTCLHALLETRSKVPKGQHEEVENCGTFVVTIAKHLDLPTVDRMMGDRMMVYDETWDETGHCRGTSFYSK